MAGFDDIALARLNERMAHSRGKLVVILGPTASGKTTAAIRLANRINGAIVSADSRQVYTGMDIGTAKPHLDQMDEDDKSGKGQVPHHILLPDKINGIKHYLINIRRPNEEMSLTEWQAAAYQTIDAIIDQHMTPILTGGTMLYIDSVVRAYKIPAVPKDDKRRSKLAAQTVEELYKQLIRVDPKAALFVQASHARRIIRALEVIEATGRPFSEMRKKGECLYEVEMYGLFPGWETLQDNVTTRVQKMLDMGLVEEKQKLIDKYGIDLPLLKTINYNQLPDKNEMIRRNMKYARRQMSWWRGREEIKWFKTAEEMLEAYDADSALATTE